MNGLVDSWEWRRNSATRLENGSIVFEDGDGFAETRSRCQGLKVYLVEAAVEADPGASVSLNVSCLDSREREVFRLSAESETGKDSSRLAHYLKTHAYSRSLRIRFEKSGEGTARITDLLVRNDDADRRAIKPTVDLDLYTKPVWEGDTAYDESVLFISDPSSKQNAALLFEPLSILSVTDASKSADYQLGRDYRIEGRTIFRLPGSRMPSVDPDSFPTGELQWHQVDGKHVLVTYRHGSGYFGPRTSMAKRLLAETLKRLVEGRPLRVVVLGDSISAGVGTSGHASRAPYVPSWPDLFAHRLRNAFPQSKIKVYNLSLGGQTSAWGKQIAPECAVPLKPDLVLIAFGMNDFWSISPDEFKANCESIIGSIRQSNRKAEFVLISSMPFDPAYTRDSGYLANMAGYPEALSQLRGAGTAFVDMHAIASFLSEVKGFRSLSVDPMHPNDYLARWYASSVSALLGFGEGW